MNKNLKKWHELGDKFDLLSQRERGMITLAVVVVLFMLCYLPLDSYFQQYTKEKAQLEQHLKQIKIAKQQVALYQDRLAIDPNTDFNQRKQLLEQQLLAIDNDFASHNIVPANHMPKLLSGLLSKTKGLEVTSFNSLTPKPLLVLEDDHGTNLNLYNHGVEIKFKGDYFAVLNFVKAVEALPDKLYWQRLDYDATNYPKAEVILEFYTLSINKDFISVAN
ncbi:MSHA biogenesis protein MshJ [Shewanella sp. SNU WT4]|uniref:MSHA biogenesis protein MshJ n=1 Tax=Shewanella sp. SNU WT4 TaxID=2590015 RepID=UPI00143CFBB1|nr:MSHA biogenesis protein MshJ [Shewanella sp. SNU WT4]